MECEGPDQEAGRGDVSRGCRSATKCLGESAQREPSPALAEERVVRPLQERRRRSSQGRSAVEDRGCTGAETPSREWPGEVPKSERGEREVSPTARSSRSRGASKSDLLPEVFPQ